MSADALHPVAPSSMTPLPPDPVDLNAHAHQHCAQCTGTLPHKLTGWDAVEVAFKDFDKQELDDYEDDINSLLVFAGLYSAVLTAFVIISYPMLQEDTAGQSLQVLRQIASQNAIISAQLSDPSIIIPSFPFAPQASQFVPSHAAIRVNVLWFASLVISLSTASLAILVKQWLREYMSFVTSSSQGQLRVRHFRRKGLETWKVFGIASALPLLLQLALLLFFVGLCYFTLDIHTSLRNTTISLVCAWGFVGFFVTIVPIFSSRCPYKTHALKTLGAAIRTRVYQRIAAFFVSRACLIADMLKSLVDKGLRSRGLSGHASRVTTSPLPHPTDILSPSPSGSEGSLVADTRRLTRRIYYMLAKSLYYICLTGIFPGPFWLILFISPLPSSVPRRTLKRLPEEREVLNDTSQDFEILVSADTLQANDELLGATMDAALQHGEHTWEQAVNFLVKIIANRVPLPGAIIRAEDVSAIDIMALSQRARDALAKIYLKYVLEAPSFNAFCGSSGPFVTSEKNLNQTIDWTVYLSVSLYEDISLLPPAYSHLILQLIAKRDTPHEHLNTILFGTPYLRTERARNVLKWLLPSHSAYGRKATDGLGLVVLARVVRAFRLPEIAAEVDLPPDLRNSLEITATSMFKHILYTPNHKFETDHLDGFTGTLSDAVYQAVHLLAATPVELQSPQLLEQLTAVFHKLFRLRSRKPLRSLLHACIKQGPILDAVHNALTVVNHKNGAIGDLAGSLEMLAMQNPNVSEALRACHSVLRVMDGTNSSNLILERRTCNILAELLHNSFHDSVYNGLLQAPLPRICRRILQALKAAITELAAMNPVLQVLKLVLPFLWALLHIIPECEPVPPRLSSSDVDLLGLCWQTIAKIDQTVPTDPMFPRLAHESWLQGFNEKNSVIGDYLCFMLFLCDKHQSNWRAQRLKAMTPKERLQILTSGVTTAREKREVRSAGADWTEFGPIRRDTLGKSGTVPQYNADPRLDAPSGSNTATGANGDDDDGVRANATRIPDPRHDEMV